MQLVSAEAKCGAHRWFDLALHVPATLRLLGDSVQISQGPPIGLGDINLRVRGDPYLYKDPQQPLSVPGSFDPITNGHLDLIERGARLVDKLIVAILRNDSKQPLFTVEERMDMLSEVVCRFPNVEVDCFDGLLVDYAGRKSATVILRGIRAIYDYEFELQMALMNRRLRPDIETVFLMAGEAYSYISSRLVKEVFGLGADISGLVPPPVEARLKKRKGI